MEITNRRPVNGWQNCDPIGFITFNEINYFITEHKEGRHICYDVGLKNGDYFDSVLTMNLFDAKEVGFKFGYKNFYQIELFCDPKIWELSVLFYQYILKNYNYNLYGNMENLFGNKIIWNIIIEKLEIKVDILDNEKCFKGILFNQFHGTNRLLVLNSIGDPK